MVRVHSGLPKVLVLVIVLILPARVRASRLAGKVDGSSPFGPTSSMAFLYILRSTSTGKFYIGAAHDVAARLSDHHRGQSPFTRTRGPWELVYQEQYDSFAEACRRERQLKSWKSHRLIQELI